MFEISMFSIAFVCAGLAGWNIAAKQVYKKKWKDLKMDYDKRCWELNDALVEKDRLNDRLNAIINSQGWNLAVRVLESQVQDKTIGEVMVVMRHKIHTFDFCIKIFEFDPNDPEDRDFAIREAEELIETIQNF